MVFLSIGVLVAGVTILSLKSSAKSASDPYTVTTEPEGGLRMTPRRLPRRSSGTAEGAAVSPKRPSQAERSYSGMSNPPSGPQGEREVMWEVGSVSSNEDEPSDKKSPGPTGGGGAGSGGKGKEGEQRVGLGIKGARGERRGLLFEDEDDEQGPEEVTEVDIERERRSRDIRREKDSELAREQEQEDGFGEFESIPASKGPERQGG